MHNVYFFQMCNEHGATSDLKSRVATSEEMSIQHKLKETKIPEMDIKIFVAREEALKIIGQFEMIQTTTLIQLMKILKIYCRCEEFFSLWFSRDNLVIFLVSI